MLDRAFFARHLEDDEHISLVLHKHWLLGLRELAMPALAFVLMLFVLTLAIGTTVFLGLAALLCIGAFVWLLRNFFDYYLDAWIITDHGIIDLEWHGWFHRQSARILYSDIQGVSYEIQGILGTLLRYGTVSIEKISTGSAISLSHVVRPRAVEGLILKNMEAYLHSKNLKDAKRVQELLSNFVATELQLQEQRKSK